MAKNKRPFSSLLDSPEAKKAVQDALHAPALLPAPESAGVQAPADPVLPTPVPAESVPRDEDGYQVITIRRSVHRLLKMASAHYGVEIREIASEAIATDPRVEAVRAMLEKNKP